MQIINSTPPRYENFLSTHTLTTVTEKRQQFLINLPQHFFTIFSDGGFPSAVKAQRYDTGQF